MTLFLLLAGLVLLLGGGTALVRGASGIASHYGVSPLLVGLTVVAFGTSAPELVVNIVAALRNETELAFGNVVGSNLANLGLVLSAAALIRPLEINGEIVRRELPVLLLGTAVLLVITLDHALDASAQVISRSDSLVLLLLFSMFFIIIASDVVTQRHHPSAENTLAGKPITDQPLAGSIRADWLYAGAGIVLLSLGGELTISKSAELAQMLGLAPVIVGMLILAIGTSLPELVTAIIAAWKKESDLCVGNIVGSNIFNSLFVLPIAALIRPLPVPAGGVVDILMTLAFSAVLLLVYFYCQAILQRTTAAALLVIYVAYMSLRVLT